jgi:hypothetical protein
MRLGMAHAGQGLRSVGLVGEQQVELAIIDFPEPSDAMSAPVLVWSWSLATAFPSSVGSSQSGQAELTTAEMRRTRRLVDGRSGQRACGTGCGESRKITSSP